MEIDEIKLNDWDWKQIKKYGFVEYGEYIIRLKVEKKKKKVQIK